VSLKQKILNFKGEGMKTKVLVVTTSSGTGECSIQKEVDEAISALGDGWQVRSAQTHTCTRPGWENPEFYNQSRIHWTTTIIMDNPNLS